jgi:hypothetical protein
MSKNAVPKNFRKIGTGALESSKNWGNLENWL